MRSYSSSLLLRGVGSLTTMEPCPTLSADTTQNPHLLGRPETGPLPWVTSAKNLRSCTQGPYLRGVMSSLVLIAKRGKMKRFGKRGTPIPPKTNRKQTPIAETHPRQLQYLHPKWREPRACCDGTADTASGGPPPPDSLSW